MTGRPRIAAALSTEPAAAAAGLEAARLVADRLGGEPPDLAFVFVSPAHAHQAGDAVAAVRGALSPVNLAACVSHGVIAGTHGVELQPGVAVWAGVLPGADLEVLHLRHAADVPDLDGVSLACLLAEPYEFPVADAVAAINARHHGVPLVGGLVTGAGAPGTQTLVANGEEHTAGALLVTVSGVPVRTVVSQGCTPFGRESVITRAEDNVVYELAGQPALERLREDVARLPDAERRLVANAILAGIVVDENKADYERGDFLVRALVGADADSGAIAVGDLVRVGQTLRFHYRDVPGAGRDLRDALAATLGGAAAAGALLFSCNGRGAHMFPTADHDPETVGELLPREAVGGLFCGGELGPVGGNVFLHGFTATLAVFLAS